MAAICTIGGIAYTMVEDQHDLTNALDERQRFQCDIIDYTGTAHFVKGEQVIITDPVLGTIYNGYLVSDKEVPQYPSGAILHTIDCSDQSWLAAKRTYTRTYSTPQLSSKIAVDQLHDVLLAEGIAQNFALKFDTTQSDFSAGILTNTAGFLNVGDGDLELAKAGSDLTITEMTTADFASGTLTNATASNNELIPTTQSALKIAVSLPGGGTGSFISIQFWSGSQTIGTSDTLNYDLYIAGTSPAQTASIDFACSDLTTLLTTSGIVDQNSLSVAATTDLSSYTKNTWYTRNIALGSTFNGKSITNVNLQIGGTGTGTYTIYVKNVYLSSASGSPFLSTTATKTVVNPPAVYQYSNYLLSSLKTGIVSVFNSTALRVSPSHSIDSVKLLKGSLMTWNGPYAVIKVSYDGGASYQVCSNNAAFPSLPVGSNITGLSIILQESFSGSGGDPTIAPTLSQLTIALYSAASATKTDIVTSYTTQTQMNTGTYTNTTSDTSGHLSLTTITPAWSSNSSSGQTSYFSSGTSQSVSSHVYTLTMSNAGGFGTSQLNFAGKAVDFTADWDFKIDDVDYASFTYRQVAFSSSDNFTFGYAVTIYHDTPSGSHLILEVGDNGNGNPSSSHHIVDDTSVTVNPGTFYHVHLVVTGNHHQVYWNNATSPTIDVIDSTFTQVGWFALRGFNNNSSGGPTTHSYFQNLVINANSGTWLSSVVSLNSLGTCGGSVISWSESNVSNVGVAYDVVEATIDGGTTWQQCSNQTTIPQLPSGTSVSGVSLQVRVTLATVSAATQPSVYDIVWRVLGAYPGSSGTRSTIPLGNDMSITRTVGSGFGTAFDGQTWTQVGTGTTAVTSGEETITNTTGDVHMVLGARTWTDEDGTCRFSLSAATISAGIELRYTDANNFYRLQATTTTVSIIKMSGGVAITLASVSMTIATGTYYRMRFRVTGATQPLLQGNVWANGALEPTINPTTGQWNNNNWTIQATD